MTQDRDPFDLLPRFVDPEPDPVVMNAVIAQSRDAFANRKAQTRRNGPFSFLNWFRKPAGWLMTSGAVAAALALAVVFVPDRSIVSPDGRDMVAERPVDTSPDSSVLSRGPGEVGDAPSQDAGTRFGAQPPPGAGQILSEPLPQIVSRFAGDGVLIGTRLDASALEIFLPDISGEETIDAQSVMPGEQVEILAAFAQPDADLIAVHFRVDDVRFWRIYQLVEGEYRRDPERSSLVSDAADDAEVRQRLETSGL